jgi:signal transduction histidine kinase
MVSTMDTALGLIAYVGALTLTVLASLLLAGFVALRARGLPGAGLLAAFLAGVALWSGAQAGVALWGPVAAPVALTILALSPLPAAAFVHLVFAFALCGALRPVAVASYALATFATLVGLIFGVGRIVPWGDFAGAFIPSPVGWGVMGVTGALSLAGHLRLLQAWRHHRGPLRDQAGAVFLSSLIGLAAISGLGFPALGVRAYPWPVLLLPFYSVVLVHGIVRHHFMLADAWARRALVWLLLLAGAGGASALIATLPMALAGRPGGFLATWGALAGTMALGLALLAPLKRLADRAVFPGGHVAPATLVQWRDGLACAPGQTELARLADQMLRDHLRMGPDGPAVIITGDTVTVHGLDHAPLAVRHTAQRFAAIVAEAARRLAAARQMIDAERAAHLAELGALAATVAHDLRNPLGIVQMAATGAPAPVRAEIGEQVTRMNALVTDILDYARAWTVTPQTVTLADLIAPFGLVAQGDAHTSVQADPAALARVLANLIDNARAMGGVLAIVAQAGPPVTLDICDNGPGIAPEIADSLFRPFVSRRPGGTGLGLAIARRIMEAHGGTLTLARRPGWTTSFRLTFGKKP